MGIPRLRRRLWNVTVLRSLRLSWATLFLLALGLVASGCGNIRTGDVEIFGIARFKLPAFPETGSHAVLIFSEMHYQPSYKSQEGPRLLPPPDSVPVTGKELHYDTLDEYRGLTAPSRVADSYDPSLAAELFRVNCLMCHGPAMRGDGTIAAMMKKENKGPLPADLTLPLTQDSAEGELFAFISRGGRQGFASIERGRASRSPMPEFRKLLTEEERWALVTYLRSQ